MSRLDSLKADLARLLRQARDIAAKAETEGRDFTTSERAEVKSLFDRAKKCRSEIESESKDGPDSVLKRFEELGADVKIHPDGSISRGGGFGGMPFEDRNWAKSVSPMLHGRKDLTAGGAIVPPPAFDQDIIRSPERPTFIRQLIPSLPISVDRFTYMRQTVRTNNAAPVAPGALKPTSVYTTDDVEERVRTIAHLSEPVKEQQLSDASFLRQFLEAELRLGLVLAEEDQLITGDGVGENFTGILNTAGIQVQAWDTDLLVTTRKAVTKIENQNLAADAWAFNPNDWERIELTQDAEDRFVGGRDLPVDRMKKALWGIQVVTSTAVPVGRGVLGAFRLSAEIHDREEPVVTWSKDTFRAAAGATDWQRNLIAFRAEERLGFAVTRPFGFVDVDLTAA